MKRITLIRQALNNLGLTRLKLRQSPRDTTRVASERLRNRTNVQHNQCDVIAIAGNEAAYITRFIHHYLALGFANIFIGINNCTDETVKITKKIAMIYSNVHLFNTDQPQKKYRQTGSYAALLLAASEVSQSSHCLIVDIDEYWFSSKISTTISDYLAQLNPFDIMFINWLCSYGQTYSQCIMDLNHAKILLKKRQGKSLFSYSLALHALRPHVPAPEDSTAIKLVNNKGEIIRIKHNPQKPKQFPQSIQSKNNLLPNDTNSHKSTSWILHQIVRSELEYSLKLFQPRVSKEPSPFRDNRKGWLMPKEQPNIPNFFRRILSEQSFQNGYRRSYENFLTTCKINKLVTSAQSRINERAITNKINHISKTTIHNHQSTWRKTFKGTRFLDQLEQRLQG